MQFVLKLAANNLSESGSRPVSTSSVNSRVMGLSDQKGIKQILQSLMSSKQKHVYDRKGSFSCFCPPWDTGQLEKCGAYLVKKGTKKQAY